MQRKSVWLLLATTLLGVSMAINDKNDKSSVISEVPTSKSSMSAEHLQDNSLFSFGSSPTEQKVAQQSISPAPLNESAQHDQSSQNLSESFDGSSSSMSWSSPPSMSSGSSDMSGLIEASSSSELAKTAIYSNSLGISGSSSSSEMSDSYNSWSSSSPNSNTPITEVAYNSTETTTSFTRPRSTESSTYSYTYTTTSTMSLSMPPVDPEEPFPEYANSTDPLIPSNFTSSQLNALVFPEKLSDLSLLAPASSVGAMLGIYYTMKPLSDEHYAIFDSITKAVKYSVAQPPQQVVMNADQADFAFQGPLRGYLREPVQMAVVQAIQACTRGFVFLRFRPEFRIQGDHWEANTTTLVSKCRDPSNVEVYIHAGSLRGRFESDLSSSYVNALDFLYYFASRWLRVATLSSLDVCQMI